MVDFEGKAEDPKVTGLLASLQASARGVQMVAPKVVPWFPTHISDIDNFSTKTLDAGTELESDHPGFNDEEYRERRRLIVATAAQYKYGQEIPRVQYTAREIETWGLVYEKLGAFTRQFAVDSYNHVLPLLENFCGYRPNNIPQLQDISDFLKTQTGFTLRPVGGLLSARDFLNGLAFRVFFSTQYIRHHTRPLYTPEPDICHELMGHAPMFADPDFADFSHEIGLASLGASDEEIKRLATVRGRQEFGIWRRQPSARAFRRGRCTLWQDRRCFPRSLRLHLPSRAFPCSATGTAWSSACASRRGS
jgi:phenylalanine-4-hydroxylase